MAKTCTYKDCNNPVWSKGLCKWHLPRKQKVGVIKKRINPIADKRLEELAIYRIARDEYLLEHPICEVEGCVEKSTHIHHKKGRIGKLVYDKKYFMAVGDACHPKKIHENPEWSREMGYLI